MYLKYKNGVEIYEASNLYSKVIRQLSNDTKWKLDDGATVEDFIESGRMIEVEASGIDYPKWHEKTAKNNNIVDSLADTFFIIRRKDINFLSNKDKKAFVNIQAKLAIQNVHANHTLTQHEIVQTAVQAALRKEQGNKIEAYQAGIEKGRNTALKECKATIENIAHHIMKDIPQW